MNFKDHQHEVIGYDLSEAACESIAEKGIQVAKDMDDLIAKLDKPRVLWLMLPCGGPMDSTIDALSEKLAADDIVIDGGNSRYTDSMQHAKICANKQIRFLDCGTSGGVSGARNGACLMVGGDKSAFDVVKDALADVAVDQGMTYTGKAGGLDTAFCATFSTNTVKKPRIDILCEYDALDLGEAIKEGSKIVHACGHNIIATTGVGAGIAMKHILEKYNLPGEIRVVGTPAEESGVIPSIAKLQVQVKSFNPNSVQMMAPKVKNCIESGALATGCKVDIKEKIGYLGRIYNHTFEKYLRANFELLGEPLKDGMVDDNGGEDFGNLMRKVPGIMPYPSLIPEKRVALHTTDYLKLVTTPRARYVVGLGSKVMADTVVDLLLNPSIIEEAKKEMQAELEKEEIE